MERFCDGLCDRLVDRPIDSRREGFAGSGPLPDASLYPAGAMWLYNGVVWKSNGVTWDLATLPDVGAGVLPEEDDSNAIVVDDDYSLIVE